MVTRPEESYRMWCVWVWSWSLDTEEALALCGLVHHVKNVSCYARTVDSSKINLFGSWTEIVNTCTAEVSCTGLVKWIAVSPVLFPVGDKTRCPCLASSRVRYSCGSEDVKRNCAILGEVFLTFIQDDFEHTHTKYKRLRCHSSKTYTPECEHVELNTKIVEWKYQRAPHCVHCPYWGEAVYSRTVNSIIK